MKTITTMLKTALKTKGCVIVNTKITNEVYKFLNKNVDTVGSTRMDDGRTLIFNLDNPDYVAIPAE